jgi:hypothetical protein
MSGARKMTHVSEYDDFAADYEWIFSDPKLSGKRRVEGLRPILAELPTNPTILDCAA